MTEKILFQTPPGTTPQNVTADAPLYGPIRMSLQQTYIQRALTTNFIGFYIGGRALGHLSTISAAALLAGTKGAAVAGVAELLVHFRRSRYNMEFGINQTLTQRIGRHWESLAGATITQRLRPHMRETLATAATARRGAQQVLETADTPGLPTRLTALPAGVRGHFIRAALALGVRHTTVTPIHNISRRVLKRVSRFVTTPQKPPRL